MDKREVATRLFGGQGIAELRRVERLTDNGTLTAGREGKTGGGFRLIYDESEVEAYKRRLDSGVKSMTPRPAKESPREQSGTARLGEVLEAMRQALPAALPPAPESGGVVPPPSVEVRHKFTLTVEEASALSGLGVGAIEREIGEGRIVARQIGPHGSRVVRRVDLERLVAELWEPSPKRRR